MQNTQHKFLLIEEEGLQRLVNPELIFSAALSRERLTISSGTGQTIIVCVPAALLTWNRLLSLSEKT